MNFVQSAEEAELKRLKHITASLINLFKESSIWKKNSGGYSFAQVKQQMRNTVVVGSQPKSSYKRLLNNVVPTKKELQTVLDELVKLDYLILKEENESTLYNYNKNRKTTKSKSA